MSHQCRRAPIEEALPILFLENFYSLDFHPLHMTCHWMDKFFGGVTGIPSVSQQVRQNNIMLEIWKPLHLYKKNLVSHCQNVINLTQCDFLKRQRFCNSQHTASNKCLIIALNGSIHDFSSNLLLLLQIMRQLKARAIVIHFETISKHFFLNYSVGNHNLSTELKGTPLLISTLAMVI